MLLILQANEHQLLLNWPKLPMFFLNILALIGGSISFTLTDSTDQWTVIVLCSISFVLLIVCIVILRADFIRELKKGFHIK